MKAKPLDILVASTPGETVLSVFARQLTRYPISQSEIRHRLNSSLSLLRIDPGLPWHLRVATGLAPPGHPWEDAKRVIYENTTAPHFLFFLPQEQREKIISNAIEGKKSLFKQMGLSMSTLPATPEYSRYCEECVEMDLVEFGFSRFHVAHQLPASAVCHIHGAPLLQARNEGPYETAGARFVMPDRCLDGDYGLRSPAWYVTPDKADKLHWLAREGAETLRLPCLESPAETLCALVARRTPRIGRAELIARAISDFWSDEVLDWLRLPLVGNKPGAWYAGSLSGVHAKPIKCLAVLGAFFPSIREFEREAADANKVRVKNDIDFNGSLPDLYAQCGGDLHSLKARVGMPMTRVLRILGEAGVSLPVRLRLKRSTMSTEVLDALREKLRSGISKSQIKRDLGLNSCNIDWVITTEPRLQAEWAKAIEETSLRRSKSRILAQLKHYPDITRERLWKNVGSHLDKVRQRDPVWVDQIIPAAHRVGKPPNRATERRLRLDEELCRACPEIAQRQLVASGRPWRVTPKSVLSVIRRYGQYTVNKAHLPKTVAMFESICETREAYEKRLLKWALAQFSPVGAEISMNQLSSLGKVTRTVVRRNLDVVECHLSQVSLRERGASMLSTYVSLAREDRAAGRVPGAPGSSVARAAIDNSPTSRRSSKGGLPRTLNFEANASGKRFREERLGRGRRLGGRNK